MKTAIKILLVFACAVFLLPAVAAPASGTAKPDWQHPVIKDYGGAIALPKADLQPDKSATYKVVFNLTKDEHGNKVNSGLDHVARAVNVLALAGVPQDHLRFVVVVHGAATVIIANNSEYRKFFHRDNPNLRIINELTAAGVKIVVCGQALAESNIPHDAVYPKVHLSLSALSDLIILQHEGYSLYPL